MKWRNSACDCLDVLHSRANAKIGEASGMEHPTVMHLHLARVVLLSPHKSLLRFAEHLAGRNRLQPEGNTDHHKQMIRRWAAQDQYKARLAMIHSGVMFWHLRRFSAGGYYEADALGLACLALWGFSIFSDRRNELSAASSNANGQHTSGAGNAERMEHSDSDDSEVCDIILLDRPTDDELVQQFVRRGQKMKAHMNGVGDLYSERAPEKVLVEGRKILATLAGWVVRDSWIELFDKLIIVTKQRRQNLNSRP